VKGVARITFQFQEIIFVSPGDLPHLQCEFFKKYSVGNVKEDLSVKTKGTVPDHSLLHLLEKFSIAK
jgi:hypothetical protein